MQKITMNCQSVKPLLSEFTDEILDASAAWQVQTHLSGCAECARISRDFEAAKRLLQALPSAAPSPGFDAALMQRLALTRRPDAPRQTWRTRIAAVFAPQLTASPAHRLSRVLRPALALGAAVAAGSAVFFFPVHPAAPVPVAALHGGDPAFVAACVAQHHRDAAAEPLADLSAQTLAGNLDNSAASGPSNETAANSPADLNSSADLNSPDPSLL